MSPGTPMLGLTNTPLLSCSPDKEAFKRRQKLQQDNEEETDENEVEEVSPSMGGGSIGEEGLGDAAQLGEDGFKDGQGTELLSAVCAGGPEMLLGILCGRLRPGVGAAAHRCGVSSGLEEGRAAERRERLCCKLRLGPRLLGGGGTGRERL